MVTESPMTKPLASVIVPVSPGWKTIESADCPRSLA